MKNGKPFLVDTGKGLNLKYKNRFFYSAHEPEECVIKKIEQLQIQEKTLVFIPAPGLGYGLKELLAKLPASSNLLCVETDPELGQLCQVPQDARLTLLCTSDPKAIREALDKLGLFHFRRTLLLPLSGGFGLERGLYTMLFQVVDEEIQDYWQNKLTLVHMAPLWIRNLFVNLYNQAKAPSLASLHTTKTVLVVGAGASLEEGIPVIRRLRDDVLLICVDTAFPVLYQYGIKPDYILVVEAQLYNLWDFMVCINPGIPLLCDLTSHPEVIRRLGCPVYLFCSRFHKNALFDRLHKCGVLPPLLPPLGSVGITALYVATLITKAAILYTGLDFAYTLHKTHSRGAPFSDFILFHSHRLFPQETQVYTAIKKRPLLKATDKEGRPLLTDLVLHSYAIKARQLIQGSNRFFCLGRGGLDLGGSLMGDGGCSLAENGCQNGDGGCGWSENQPLNGDGGSISLIQDFFQAELALLEHGAQTVNRLLACKGEAGQWNAALEELAGLDYTWLHFPDPVRLPTCEEHFLVRLLVSIKHYQELIERLVGGETP